MNFNLLSAEISAGAAAGIITAAFIIGLVAGLVVYFKKVKKK